MSTLAATAERFAAGEPVLVGDESDETVFLAGDAGQITSESLAQLHELGRGTVVLGLADEAVERLRLEAPGGPAEGLRMITPIDAATRRGAGWSLNDRAHTMRVASDVASGPADVRVPGHVLAARIGASVAGRPSRPSRAGGPSETARSSEAARSSAASGAGAAAAALELARLAGPSTAVALVAVLDHRGAVARLADLRQDTRLRRLAHASSGELRGHAVSRETAALAATCELPTRYGHFRGIAFGDERGDGASVALIHGNPADHPAPLVHVHVACRFGDVFGSLLCGCRDELAAAAQQIVAEGCGVIVYAQSPEAPQLTCGRLHPVDFPMVAGLLRAAGIRSLRPTPAASELAEGLRAHGLDVLTVTSMHAVVGQ